jgi:NAD(P)-dependent dehydrogenase (short-subunit alcohol dehydrogenase family)
VITGDGVEATLAVNHVGHYLLTELLRPALRKAGSARVIIVSSIAHTRGRIHLEDLTLEKAYTGYAAYAQSKLANVMHALDLAAANSPAELAVYSLHPGVISTKLLREGFGPVRGSSPHHGAATSIRLATAESIAEPSGTYFSEGYPTPVAAAANDVTVRDALRAATEKYAGLTSAA